MKLAQAKEQNIRASEQEQISAAGITSGIKGLGNSAVGFMEAAGLFGDEEVNDLMDSGLGQGMNVEDVKNRISNMSDDEIRSLIKATDAGVDYFAPVTNTNQSSIIPYSSSFSFNKTL